MRRAIKDTQKEERRQAILDVAWELFQQQRYEAINILDIAQGAGLAKGTIYLYFKTKEELFFAIQEQQFEYWFDQVDAGLSALNVPAAPEAIVELIVAPLTLRPALPRLFAIVHAVLEQNVDLAAIVRFKRMLYERVARTSALVERCVPDLPAGEGARFVMRVEAVMVGMQQLAAPLLNAEQIKEHAPELQPFAIDFASELSATLTALLDGMRRS